MSTAYLKDAFAARERAAPTTDRAREFVYRHTVCFEETNLVGNVYYVRHLGWQGRCREMFLSEHAPGVIAELARDLRLVTLRVECEYFEEFRVFDVVELHMRLARQVQNRIALDFDYILVRAPDTRLLAARGSQEIGCMRETPGGLVPTDVPAELAAALRGFAPSGG